MSEHVNNVNQALGYSLEQEFHIALTDRLGKKDDTVIAIFDLDHLNEVNSDFGREEGDRVIIESARHIESRLKPGDEIYRRGGDEFAVIFADGTAKEIAFLRANDICASLSVVRADGKPMMLSAGVASAPDDAETSDELARKAVSAFIRAKNAGGACVCLARDEKLVPKTTHYTTDQLSRLTKAAARAGVSEAILLREALDMLLKKYDI